MTFEVVRTSDNRHMMITKEEACIPYHQLDSMSKSGYYFLLDGKRASVKDVKLLQNNVQDDLDSTLKELNNTPIKSKSKMVRCVDTGEIFKNQSEAARHFNIDPAQVSDSIKTGRPRSGYTFERVVE